MIGRREFLASTALAAAAPPPALTRFQLACMTLPYGAFPLERALTGIAGAGYRFVAWGVNHVSRPVLAVDAPPRKPRAWPRAAATWIWNR